MRLSFLAACAALLVPTCAWAQNPDLQYGRKNTFSVFTDYSNDSSHIFLGQEENRKIAALGVGYSRRLAHKRLFDFTYEAEIRPLTFVRDPFVTGTTSVVVQNFPIGVTGSPITGSFSGPTKANCASGTSVFNGITEDGILYTETTTQQCSERWTYAGGMSPLGLRFGFAKRRRVQPYVVANGGFLVAPHDIPVNDSARFNFTFEGGAGIEVFRDRRHSFAIDYRVRHMSNGYRGFYNPGVDSGVFRVSYRFGR
jgi:hypothetical protein